MQVPGNITGKIIGAITIDDDLVVDSARVMGDIQAEKSSGRLQVKKSDIGGNLQFVENYTGPYTITDNFIDVDLQFFKNIGKGTITGNRVGGNLQSKENSPQPTILNNAVEGENEIE